MPNNHTPGPWSIPHFARPDVGCDCRWILAEPYMGSICEISLDNAKLISEGGNDSPALAEAQANARLIAAAPDLYEVLRLIADSTAVLNHLDPEYLQAISEALAKVEGR